MQIAFAYWLFTVISAGIAAFVGAYLKQKGQNLATHEDIQNLVRQVEATTAATKAIEGRISDEFWNKQRVWEMKRDTLLGLLTNVRSLEETISELNVFPALLDRLREGSAERSGMVRNQATILQKWGSAWSGLQARRSECNILCSPEVSRALDNLSTKLVEFYNIARDGNITSFAEVGKAFREVESPLYAAIQKELGVTPPST